MNRRLLAVAVLVGCGRTVQPTDEVSTPAPAPSVAMSPPATPGIPPGDTDPVPLPPPAPSSDRFRCPIDGGKHRAAWNAIDGAVLYRAYETEEGNRRLAFESKEPSVFFSTSTWVSTTVEIVSVDASGAESLVWEPFSQGITIQTGNQLVAVGEDAQGPVLQIRDCMQYAEADYAPELAVRSLRIPGATELRGLAMAKQRRELFLRDAHRVLVLRQFTLAGSDRDETGAVRLDLAEVVTTSPLGAGAALAFADDALYIADAATIIRAEPDAGVWRETSRSGQLPHEVARLEAAGSLLHVVLEAPASERLIDATWQGTTLAFGEPQALPFDGPILTTVNDEGAYVPAFYVATPGDTVVYTAGGGVAFTVPSPIVSFSAGGDFMQVRAADGSVRFSATTGANPTSFRMPPATIHAQLAMPRRSIIIE